MSDLNENMNNKCMSFQLPTGGILKAYAAKSTDLVKTTWLAQETNIFEKLIDTLPIGFIVSDSDHRILAWNRTYLKIFGIEKILDKIYEQYGENFLIYSEPPENINVVKESLELLSANNTVVLEIETKEHKVIKKSLFPFNINKDKQTHLMTFEDVTELKKTKNMLMVSKEEAEKANRAKSEFLSKMSHELRTPLNGILGFAQLLELESSLTNQQQMFVQEIIKGGKHLLSLINDILDLSRIEIGKLKITNEIVKLRPIINECISLVSQTEVSKGIKIINKLNTCADKLVNIDPVRLRQVVLNLLDNAIKYNKVNGEIIVTSKCENATLFIHIIDNGIGISNEEQKNIFKPFYRVRNLYQEGAGIGLPLVKQLIELMGGTIGVVSREGEGSDFWFSLPIQINDNELNILDSKSVNKDLPKTGEKTILYIEDNPSNLQLVSSILNRVAELNLLTATTGSIGIQIASHLKIDLILLDIHLPDMSGFEVMNRLRTSVITKDIPVIAISASAMHDDIHRALSKGFKDYITKPINVESFLSSILNYIDNEN